MRAELAPRICPVRSAPAITRYCCRCTLRCRRRSSRRWYELWRTSRVFDVDESPPASPSIELSIILPAYNEELAVAGAVETYLRALAECGASFEIVVIDDGSADGTFATAERAAAGH